MECNHCQLRHVDSMRELVLVSKPSLAISLKPKSDEGSFTLISHLEENLTIKESAEKIAEHFAKISQEFPPLGLKMLPDSVKVKVTCFHKMSNLLSKVKDQVCLHFG